MRKTKVETQQKPKEKPVSRDKIEDNWRPAAVVVEPEPDLEVYHTGRKLGKGGFAVCFEGTLKRTGQLFAMKVVKSRVEQKKQLDKVSLSDFQQRSKFQSDHKEVPNGITNTC